MSNTPERVAKSESNFGNPRKDCIGGMNERVKRLRNLSVDTQPSLSIERALIETAFYK